MVPLKIYGSGPYPTAHLNPSDPQRVVRADRGDLSRNPPMHAHFRYVQAHREISVFAFRYTFISGWIVGLVFFRFWGRICSTVLAFCSLVEGV